MGMMDCVTLELNYIMSSYKKNDSERRRSGYFILLLFIKACKFNKYYNIIIINFVSFVSMVINKAVEIKIPLLAVSRNLSVVFPHGIK